MSIICSTFAPRNVLFMKKIVKIFILLAAMACCGTQLSAQVTHYLGAYAQAGEFSYLATLYRPAFDMKSSLGGGGGLGFVYEMRAGHFLLDVGVGGNTAWTRFKVPDRQYVLHNMIDSEGEVFDFVYDVSHRRDAYWTTSLQVPLLLGGQWGHFYFLAGAKFDMALMTTATMKADISTLGDYKQYMVPLHNIPAQGFVDNMAWMSKRPVAFKPGVTASWEIGCRLGEVYKETGYDVPKQTTQFRIALFGDYGILDTHVATQTDLMHIPATYNAKQPLQGLDATDVMSCKEVSDIQGMFHSFMIGVKFTVLFRMPESKACVICREQPFRSTHGILE